MSHTDIILKAYEVLDAFKETEDYKELQYLHEQIQHKYMIELKNYHTHFKRFEEVFNQGGTYHPDFKEVSRTYQETKIVLFEKEEVKRYFLLERTINEKLSAFSFELMASVSNYYNQKGGSYCGTR